MSLIRRLADLLGDTALADELTRQLGAPSGLLGHIVGRGLARSNADLTRWVIAELDPGPADAILEVGCGPAVGATAVLERAGGGSYDGVDPSATMCRQARRRNRREIEAGRVRIHGTEAAELPFPDHRFDGVLGCNVVYFWPDPLVELLELLRVLKPGGRIALGIRPRDAIPHEARERFEGVGHRTFRTAEIRELLEEAGFVDVHAVTADDGYAAGLGHAPGQAPAPGVHDGS